MIYQWRPQNIVKMGIVFITSRDHLKNRSYFPEHPKQNNKDLTPGLGGQFLPAKCGQGYWFPHLIYILKDQTQIVLLNLSYFFDLDLVLSLMSVNGTLVPITNVSPVILSACSNFDLHVIAIPWISKEN